MMNEERHKTILDILQGLDSLDGLKRLFWQELNYERQNKPLSPRQWQESARQALAEEPVLFASGGEENAFHIVYCRLAAADLRRGPQRPVVNQLLRDHPYALFVFSNKRQSAWHFLNVKYDEQAEKRRLVRRITVKQGEGLRTAAERLAMLDLQAISPDLFGLSPLLIQQHHDEAFDVEKVTKEFYREIANWYFWALKYVEFPENAPKEKDGRDHISVIRLITRLIFCWFIREKGLMPDVLFDRRRLTEMIEGFAPDKPRNTDSVFYRAILQNLFFATLNTEINQRGWRREDQNFMAHCLYRYKDCFRDPKTALGWFKDIPFLNGGLFECLDKDLGEGTNPRYLRVDGFSDRPDSRPTVPDFLFFGPEQEVNLSEDYGDKKSDRVCVRGLILTLDRYKFTIEENTPFDQEVALDPELCGKVFENLLAAYNPETGTTARKATGSFYTPREIVDYMVDESLMAYLKGKLGTDDAQSTEKKLRALQAYDEETPAFSNTETEVLIDAIDDLKALDPAVGSGAFPMGILHKLVHVLGKLDPDNAKWKARQIAKLDDAVMRDETERIFRDNYDNYGRKLYLIENCIYGVDIQPIAVQIAKMRFFISLIVDQKINPDAPNLGVRALPNLETKFVAANTLIGIERPKQMLLRNPEIDRKEAELRRVRDQHFTARTLKAKANCRNQDSKLRTEIAELLRHDGWDNTTARQLAAWDPYDQNASSPFFDSEWMFGVTTGFDICIANPPYLSTKHGFGSGYGSLLSQTYSVARGQYDAYAVFLELAVALLRDNGTYSFIVPKPILSNANMSPIRHCLGNWSMLALADVGRPFEQSVESVVLIGSKAPRGGLTKVWTVASALYGAPAFVVPWERVAQKASIWNPFAQDGEGFPNCGDMGLPRLGEFFDAVRGIEMGKGDSSICTSGGKGRYRLLRGEDVAPFRVDYSGYWVSRERNNDKVYKPLHIYSHPLLMVRRVANRPIAALSTDMDYHVLNTIYVLVPKAALPYALEVYCALLNSDFVKDWFAANFLNDDKIFPYIRKAQLLDIPVLAIRRDDDQYDRLLKVASTAVRENGENPETLAVSSGIVGDIAKTFLRNSKERIAEQ